MTAQQTLEKAMYEQDIEMINKALDDGADVNLKNEYGETPLFNPSALGWLDSIKILLANGAEINVKNVQGETPLTWAVRSERVECAKYLISHGADWNYLYNMEKNMTPLFSSMELIESLKP